MRKSLSILLSLIIIFSICIGAVVNVYSDDPSVILPGAPSDEDEDAQNGAVVTPANDGTGGGIAAVPYQHAEWKEHTLPNPDMIKGIATNKGTGGAGAYTPGSNSSGAYIAISDNAIFRSEDRDSWKQVYKVQGKKEIMAVCYGNGSFIAVGCGENYSALVLASKDGTNWSDYSSQVKEAVVNAEYCGSNFILTCYKGGIYSSTDGVAWAKRDSKTGKCLNHAAFGNGIYIAVGEGGTIVTSKDMASWTSQKSNTREDLYGTAFKDGSFVAVGRNGVILYSTDSKNWSCTEYSYERISDVLQTKEGFIAVGKKCLLQSSDGKNWSSISVNTQLDMCNVIYDGEIYMASGNSNVILQSSQPTAGTPQTASSAGPLEITTSSQQYLPEAKVGEPYSMTFTAKGGVPPYKWEIAQMKFTALHMNETTGELSGTPDTDGTSWVLVTVSDSAGAHVYDVAYVLIVRPAATTTTTTPTSPSTGTVSTNPPTTTPATPGSNSPGGFLTATAGDGFVKLQWQPVGDDIGLDGYYIYRGTAAGGEEKEPLNDFPVSGGEYKDTTVQNGTVYYYTIKPSYSSGQRLGDAYPEVSVKADGKGKITLEIGNPNMTVNGVTMEIDPGKGTAPVTKNDKTFVPIRAIIESMGGKLDWDGNEQKITITLKDKNVTLWVNKTTATVNGETKTLLAAPYLSDTGRTMIPLRFVTENLGCTVQWDGATHSITINY